MQRCSVLWNPVNLLFQVHAEVLLFLEPCVFSVTLKVAAQPEWQLVTMQKGFPLSSKQDYFNPCTKWNKVISLTSKYSLATESNGWKASYPGFNTKNVAARLNLPKGAIRKYMYLIHLSEEKMAWGSNVIFY